VRLILRSPSGWLPYFHSQSSTLPPRPEQLTKIHKKMKYLTAQLTFTFEHVGFASAASLFLPESCRAEAAYSQRES